MFTTVQNPVQAAPTERDHFIEIQHVVQIILDAYHTVWYQRPMGEFIDLATYISDKRNLFLVTRNLNQTKKNIPFEDYWENELIMLYEDFYINQEGSRTVRMAVRELLQEMANRVSEYPTLTRLVGREALHVLRMG